MTQTDKLLGKLQNGTITGSELVSLLGKLGWTMNRQKGSHQTWTDGVSILVIIAERKDLKPYQIKDAKKALIGEDSEKKK